MSTLKASLSAHYIYALDTVLGQASPEPDIRGALPYGTLIVVGRDVALQDGRLVLVASGLAVLVGQGEEACRVVRFLGQHPLEVTYPVFHQVPSCQPWCQGRLV